MMPLGAPSISKYGSLVRLGAQIVALRAHTALKAPPKCPLGGTPRQLPHCHGPLSTHGPLGDIPPLSTEAVIYGVIVNHDLHT